MRTLVTGASGLLGHELCRQLKEIGHEVWALDNHSRSDLIPPHDHWYQADLMDNQTLDQLPTNFDYIFHYGAVNGTKNFYDRPNTVMRNNMIGDLNIFALAMLQSNLCALVYASSSEVVSGDPISPTAEHTDITIKNIHNARWSYRLPKISAENYLVNSDLPWLILRYFNIYGSQSKPGHFVADQIIKIKQDVFEITGANETRSFCHVQDAVKASIYLASSAEKQVINIGNDQEITIADAAEIIARALGKTQIGWISKPSLAGSTQTRRPDITKLRSLMPEYDPRSFTEGMREVVANGDW